MVSKCTPETSTDLWRAVVAAHLGDQMNNFDRVIVRAARGYSGEANPKYIRDVSAVLGLEDSRLVTTPSVKRTPTTESVAELENEKRAVCRTAVGKLFYMCLQRADIYVQFEKTRQITCSIDSDDLNVKRIAFFLKGVPSAKWLIDINTFPQYVNVYPDSDWANMQEYKRWSYG